MSMTDAKDLHADITRLLLDLHMLKETIANKPNGEPAEAVEITGGTF
jgi:hypothetical protein